jgi:hypothetical protein
MATMKDMAKAKASDTEPRTALARGGKILKPPATLQSAVF